MSLKTIIIDDEPFARSDLSNMLLAYENVWVAGEAGNITDARKLLAENRFDLVFLDICLRGGTGFELIPFIAPSARIVFITGHDDYAIQTFEINAVDCLFKPVSRERLSKILLRVKPDRKTNELESSAWNRSDPLIRIKVNSGQRFVSMDEIIVISSMGGNYICVHLKNNEKLLCRKTLKEWESVLPDSGFIRIHRSTIINTNFIKHISYEKDGFFQVFLFNQNNPFAVSRRRAFRLKGQLRAIQ